MLGLLSHGLLLVLGFIKREINVLNNIYFVWHGEITALKGGLLSHGLVLQFTLLLVVQHRITRDLLLCWVVKHVLLLVVFTVTTHDDIINIPRLVFVFFFFLDC